MPPPRLTISQIPSNVKLMTASQISNSTPLSTKLPTISASNPKKVVVPNTFSQTTSLSMFASALTRISLSILKTKPSLKIPSLPMNNIKKFALTPTLIKAIQIGPEKTSKNSSAKALSLAVLIVVLATLGLIKAIKPTSL